MQRQPTCLPDSPSFALWLLEMMQKISLTADTCPLLLSTRGQMTCQRRQPFPLCIQSSKIRLDFRTSSPVSSSDIQERGCLYKSWVSCLFQATAGFVSPPACLTCFSRLQVRQGCRGGHPGTHTGVAPGGNRPAAVHPGFCCSGAYLPHPTLRPQDRRETGSDREGCPRHDVCCARMVCSSPPLMLPLPGQRVGEDLRGGPAARRSLV